MKKVKPAISIENEDLKKKIIHPPEKEDELFVTRLPVYSPYEFTECKGELLIAASAYIKIEEDITDNTISELKNKLGQPSFINPFVEEYLLEDLANINLTDDQSILAFCNKYGLYGQNITKTEFSPLLSDPLKLEVKEKVLVNISENYEYFFQNTALIQLAIKVINYEIPFLEKQYKEGKNPSTLEELKTLKKTVITIVNRGLRLVSPSINLGDNEEALPSYTSHCLLGAAYYHLYEAITQGKKFRECLFCRSLFVPRSPIGKYCPPTQLDKHSSCENSYNQMKSRARKSVREKGKSIEDVAKRINRPIEEVRGWFN
ncbi:hypothetical protein ABES02_04370 [Neobacillus pocheonensis]|uniref:hypothetical protein n=1 Tax=Neobacillus pocheonensis TaxID=363869 RepID=UPI003D28E442